MNTPALAALLLAGGASTRMGFPKALLSQSGQPLWQVQLGRLDALGPEERFLSAPRELALHDHAWKTVHDDKPDLGPLAGMAAAVRIMSADWLLVLAVDLPHMTSEYLGGLCDRASASGRGQVPEMDGQYLGLSAVYPRDFLTAHLKTHLRSEDRSVQRFVQTGISLGLLEVCPVAKNEHRLFQNVNTPVDLVTTGLIRPMST
jgi:molybdopterin-guanine dinucleotide biosynthesis protein A